MVALSDIYRPHEHPEDGPARPLSLLFPPSTEISRTFTGSTRQILEARRASVTPVVLTSGQGPQPGGGGGVAVAVLDVVDGRRQVVDRVEDVALARLGVGGERRRQHLHEPERAVRVRSGRVQRG